MLSLFAFNALQITTPAVAESDAVDGVDSTQVEQPTEDAAADPAETSEPVEPVDQTEPVAGDGEESVTAPDPGASVTDEQTVEAATGTEAPGAGITPLSVPVPGPNEAVITVKVGGDRLANGSVQGLAGVRLALSGPGTATSNTTGAVNPVQGAKGTRYNAAWAWTTCVSDAAGDCSFVIPIRAGTISATGVPQDTRFWVVQEAGPSGWYSNPTVRVGSSTASFEVPWEYRFRTDTQLRPGVVYSSTTPLPWGTAGDSDPDRFFMRNRVDTSSEGARASNFSRTTGIWSQSRNNPALAAECQLDIAFISDTSTSLGPTGLAALKSAMSTFVDELRGTSARMAAFSFSFGSPGDGNAPNYPTLLPVGTTAQAQIFKNQFAGWIYSGATNWDAGFAAAANATPHYDLAIFLTDGNPTYEGDINDFDPTMSAFNSIRDLDAGVFSANQLKAEGTQVIALGVGPALTAASEYNLRAVSGPTAGTDYFRAADFDEATDKLVEIANQGCNSSLGVQKMIVPAGGTIADATPAPAGWVFEAAPAPTAPAGGLTVAPSSQTTVAGGSGKVDFGLTFTLPTTQAPIRVNEVQQTGYTLLPVAGKNAVCTNAETGAALTVTNSGTAAKPGFDVGTQVGVRAECRMYNQAAPAPATVAITKRVQDVKGANEQPGVGWTVGAVTTATTGTATANPSATTQTTPASGTTAPWTITFGTGASRASVTVSETQQAGWSFVSGSCTVTPPTGAARTQTIPNAAGTVLTNIAPGEAVACTFVNKPQPGTVTWGKVDGNGDRLKGSSWTITGPGTPGAVLAIDDCIVATCAGPDTDARPGYLSVTGLAWGSYSLVETKAPAGYVRDTTPRTFQIGATAPASLTVSLGAIANVQQTVPAIPLTGGIGRDHLLIAGAALLLFTVGLAVWQHRRRRTA